MTSAVQGFLLSFITNKNSPKSEINLIGENMKYKNIEIKKSTNNKSWFARFRKNNQQFYVSAKTQKECLDKVKELYNKKETTINKNYTLLNWYNKWLSLYKKDVREGTIKEYKNNLRHINHLLDIDITQIKTIDLLTTISNINYERQRQKVYEFLNDLFKKAYINEIIEKDPMLKIEKPKHKKETVIPLTKQDEQKIIKYCEEKQLDYFLLALYQGLRLGEMLAVEISDFDFINKKLTINKSLDLHNKQGETKNDYSKREVPLLNKTIKIIEKYKNTNGRIFKIAKQTASKKFKILRTELSLNTNYKIKSLRSTFITHCAEENIPLHIIQSWVGHVEGSQVTKNVYTKAREETKLFYFNKINN